MGALGLFLYLGKVFILMFSSKRNLFYNRTDPGCKSQHIILKVNGFYYLSAGVAK